MRSRLTVALLFWSALPLLAQESTLAGSVTDAHGAVVPGAVIKAVNGDTSQIRSAISGAQGAYEISQINPGKYSITVEKPGFRTHATTVVLQTNTPLTLDVKLEVGAVTETINVTAEASVVNTENATVGNPFTETQIKEIPLQTRNIVALLGIQPGVASTGQVAGARNDQNNVLLDGVDVNDNQSTPTADNGFNAVLPIPLDSVQEFNTTVAGQGAGLGSYAGGQVSIITKSGSNQFHGTAYEYNRNTDLAADSWFSNRAGVARAALVRNQYGFSVGGPIIKNKLFFFYNWEARKDRSATAENRTVPSATFQAGEILVPLKNGPTVTLQQSDVIAIDPLHLGESAFVKSYMAMYPAGNNPLGSPDKGLNTNSLLFNAPSHLDNHAQVAKLDYNLDPAGKYTFSMRGTLNGASQDSALAQFPGQAAASKSLDNSRGLSGRATQVLSPHLVNVFNYGYTRLGTASTGVSTVIPTLYFTAPIATPRQTQREAPTTTIADDLTWSHGKHTVTTGIAFHFSQNDHISYSNYPSYSFSEATLLGLGGDIGTDVLNYVSPNATLSSTTQTANAFGAMFGMLNNYGATYNYTSKGTAIPFGSPVTTAFVNHEYEFYGQDAYKWKKNVTITVGLRYSLPGVPFEINGTQVTPVTPLNNYFAQRQYAANAGISNSLVPDALVQFALGGPVNNAPGYYPLDTGNWAPRFGIAYSPEYDGLLGKIIGKGSVLRAGWAMVYDHYGTQMAQSLASSGSPGLATAVTQPVNGNYTTSFRYTGNGYPTLPAAPAGGFPLTPPVITGGFNTFSGVSSTLKAPYSYLTNISYARPLPKKLSLELGYIGRIGKRQIVNQDYGQPLTNFKDSISGQTLQQAGAPLAALFDSGVTPAMVKANPSLVPNEPFFNNVLPGAANYKITGNASANFFYLVYSTYSGSWLDALNDVDRLRQTSSYTGAGPLTNGCISKFGCNTFYMLQNSGFDVYTNNGFSNYNAGTVTLRRAVSGGWGFDLNYTFGHSLDNGSASESAGGAALQDAFNPRAYYGPSDFDARQSYTADAVVQIPVGKGKMLLGNAPGWLNQIVGGWQATTLVSFHTGTPVTISGGSVYNVNYDSSAFGILNPGVALPAHGLTFDSSGIPSIFSNPNVSSDFSAAGPGVVGTRGILRGPNFFNADVAASKNFTLPWEHITLSFRAEAFNVLNSVVFGNPGASLGSATTFGEITGYASGAAPRVMQMALRLGF